MDLVDIKGRIAVALVESIFRRAGFDVTGAASPEGVPRPGREDVTPEFTVTRNRAGGACQGRWPVAVRYRAQPGQYLRIEEQRGAQALVAGAKRAWPDLLVVLVTDRPAAGRSGF